MRGRECMWDQQKNVVSITLLRSLFFILASFFLPFHSFFDIPSLSFSSPSRWQWQTVFFPLNCSLIKRARLHWFNNHRVILVPLKTCSPLMDLFLIWPFCFSCLQLYELLQVKNKCCCLSKLTSSAKLSNFPFCASFKTQNEKKILVRLDE